MIKKKTEGRPQEGGAKTQKRNQPTVTKRDKSRGRERLVQEIANLHRQCQKVKHIVVFPQNNGLHIKTYVQQSYESSQCSPGTVQNLRGNNRLRVWRIKKASSWSTGSIIHVNFESLIGGLRQQICQTIQKKQGYNRSFNGSPLFICNYSLDPLSENPY